jgi:hypothetical protein
MLMICLVSPSISATSPVSRSVVEKMLSMLVVVHLLLRTVSRRYDHLPGWLSSSLHAELRRLRRILLDIARHHIDRLQPSISPEVCQLGMPAGEP